MKGITGSKAGVPSQASDLLGFASWQDVMLFSMQQEGQYLRGLVALVNEYGEDTMLTAIQRCEKQERSAQVLCSTAHRAKGGEWGYVRLDSDFESAFLRRHMQEAPDKIQTALEAEKRLVYVALTRARFAVEIPSYLLARFNVKETTRQTMSRADLDMSQSSPSQSNETSEEPVLPSFWKDAAEENDARRQLFW
jgi:superfamily I DNA/RNA helicase